MMFFIHRGRFTSQAIPDFGAGGEGRPNFFLLIWVRWARKWCQNGEKRPENQFFFFSKIGLPGLVILVLLHWEHANFHIFFSCFAHFPKTGRPKDKKRPISAFWTCRAIIPCRRYPQQRRASLTGRRFRELLDFFAHFRVDFAGNLQ